MLKKMHLKNFRKHTDTTLDFTSGVNAIVGRNEAGKTTIIEAIAYAMYGTKALRGSIDDVATHGIDAKEMCVEIEIEHGGRSYAFKRSKMGAEVHLGGKVFVTGQTEVSNFAEKITGVPLTLAQKLMFSGQNSIRAALEEGPKALSVMIENLAGMGVFDRILGAAQEKLPTGNISMFEERLAGEQVNLENALATLPPEPNVEKFEFDSREMNKVINAIECEIIVLKDDVDSQMAVVEEMGKAKNAKLSAFEKVNALKMKVEDVGVQIEQAEVDANRPVDSITLEVLKKAVADIEYAKKQASAHNDYVEADKLVRFEGDEVTFEKHVAKIEGAISTAESSVAAAEKKINKLRSQRITGDVCQTCGQGVSHLTHVIETNERLDIEIEALMNEALAQSKLIDELRPEMGEIRAIQRATQAFMRLRFGEFCTFDTAFHPPKVIWNGGTLVEAGNVDLSEIAKLESDIEFVKRAQIKVELLNSQLDDVKRELDSAEALYSSLPSVAEEVWIASGQKLSDLNINLRTTTDKFTEMVSDLRFMSEAHEKSVASWERIKATVDSLRAAVQKSQEAIETVSFNNALIKKLRALRPLIADKIWNKVLVSVSTMFSQIRGEKSVITKEKSGFLCNGTPIESLSGSTMDALGLALRIALVRIFTPACDLVILDEPAQGMDRSRVLSMLGFIQSVGVTQTLLITHDEVSESISENVVAI